MTAAAATGRASYRSPGVSALWRRIVLSGKIESPQAIRELDGIMAPPEVDALFIGPADLA